MSLSERLLTVGVVPLLSILFPRMLWPTLRVKRTTTLPASPGKRAFTEIEKGVEVEGVGPVRVAMPYPSFPSSKAISTRGNRGNAVWSGYSSIG